MRYVRSRTIRGRSAASLALMLSLSARAAWADPIAYAGKIVDTAGNPLPWALVSVAGSGLSGQASADGSFSLAGEAPAGIPSGPRPDGPVRGSVRDFRRSDGRAVAPSVTSMLLWARPSGTPGRDAGPQAPSAAARLAAGWTLSASMARFATGTFPQAAPSAKGLILILAPSATDTAVYAAEKQACLDTLNALRAGIGKPKLAWSKSLEAFADQGARYDSQAGAHAHFQAYARNAVPADAENALPGWPLKDYKSVAAVVRAGTRMMWDEGPGGGHYDNIAGDQKEAGCGIYVTASGAVWVIQDFK